MNPLGSQRNRVRRTTGISAIVGLVLLLGGLIATAFANYAQVGSYSDVEEPRKAAVESSTGNLFVVDSAADQVKVLAPDGDNLTDLTVFGSAVLDDPYGIAIDESGSSSAIYVSSQSNGGEIVKFSSDGEATPSFSVDATFTSPAQGNANDQIGDFHAALALAPNNDLWVADSGNNLLKRFDNTGAHVGGSNIDGSGSGTAFQGLMDVATDSTGDLLVVDSNGDVANQAGTSRVERFAPDGSHEGTIGPVGPNSRPASIAVNDDDQVIVSGEQDAVYADQSPIVQVYGTDGALLEEPALSGLQWDTIQGLAAAASKSYVVHDVGRYFGSPYGSPGIQVLKLLSPPTANIDPVDAADVTADSAIVSGEVNPTGSETEFSFEYRRGSGEWQLTEPASAGDGSTPIATGDVVLDGLQANSSYEVRLRASNADGEDVTDAESFQTDVSAPGVSALPAADVSESSAWLRARLNPFGSATAYHFEWGEDGNLDSQLPADGERLAGSGNNARVVSLPLRGLEPGKNYSFRLIATNEHGTTEGAVEQFTTTSENACPNADVRNQQGSMYLPDCRAYEQVSPADKGGYSVASLVNAQNSTVGLTINTPEGDRAAYSSFGIFADGAHGMPHQYVANRGTDGWSSNSISPAPVSQNPTIYSGSTLAWNMASSDLSLGVGSTREPLVPEDTGLNTQNLYAFSSPHALELVDKGNNGEINLTDTFQALAVRGQSVVFHTPGNLVSADTDRYVSNFVRDIYVGEGGTTHLVNVDSDEQLLNRCGSMPGSRPIGGSTPNPRGAISADGSRIVFATPAPDIDPGLPDCAEEVEMYMRIDNEETVEVSASQATVDDPYVDNPEFLGASKDGDVVYFQSAEKLVDGVSGGGLYRFDVDTRALELVQAGGGMKRVRTSPDGSHVYFTSHDDLVPDQGSGVPDTNKLYVYSDGETRLVAEADGYNFGGTAGGPVDSASEDHRSAEVSDDGERLVFSATEDLTGYESHGKGQVFLYDDDAESVQCLSCGDLGTTPETSQFDRGRISPDGSVVVFTTRERLLSQDSNKKNDIYAWKDGALSLISSGQGARDDQLVGISDDGSSVFLLSYSRLARQDGDDSNDLYVARVNGGFLAEEQTTDICRGDSCQAPPATAPASEEIGSGSESSGNPDRTRDTSRCKTLSQRSKKAANRAKQLSKKAKEANGRRKQALKKKAKAKRKVSKRLRADAAKCRREAK